MSSLGIVERKVLGAMFILSDEKSIVKATKKQLAHIMGYKNSGGAITFAIKNLELNNHIMTMENGDYKVFI